MEVELQSKKSQSAHTQLFKLGHDPQDPVALARIEGVAGGTSDPVEAPGFVHFR